MAAINDLIAQVSDEELRTRLEAEVNKMAKQKKFGLVFEEHMPECTPLYGLRIKRGTTVARPDAINETYTVMAIEDGVAVCKKKTSDDIEKIDARELVPVAEFGEPIYPYLEPLDSICNAPDSDLWHTLIEADNYHALQLLEYLYAGKVDCIYIDPPYNTGAKDWKYNNDYVDGADSYRHSKWLSFMEKRLKIAKKLLKNDGVLIIAIDDYEEAHLVLLLEDVYPSYDISPVIINHHPQGGGADNISRTHEYALFVTPKGKKIIKGNKSENLEESWSLTRGGTDIRNLRVGRPNSFYAIYVDNESNKVIGVGPHLDVDTPYSLDDAPNGCTAYYPIGKDGTERVWRYERDSMSQHIEDGDIIRTPNGTLNVVKRRDVKYDNVFSVWTDGRYNAGTHGTSMISSIFDGDTRFSYPKSLYTVYDCLRFSVQDKPNALILDFFAGSGTTLHAVNLLNSEDCGHRRCIMVTNNEVSNSEEKSLKKQGYKNEDEIWRKQGIAQRVTWPRTVLTIKGVNSSNLPLSGNYITNNAPMSDGFRTNAIFFRLGFLDKNAVALGRQFKEMLPTLWMKAGAKGECPKIEGNVPSMLILPENSFAVLTDENKYNEFAEKVKNNNKVNVVYIITDSEAGYKEMTSAFDGKETYQLYRDYLDNFRINVGR